MSALLNIFLMIFLRKSSEDLPKKFPECHPRLRNSQHHSKLQLCPALVVWTVPQVCRAQRSAVVWWWHIRASECPDVKTQHAAEWGCPHAPGSTYRQLVTVLMRTGWRVQYRLGDHPSINCISTTEHSHQSAVTWLCPLCNNLALWRPLLSYGHIYKASCDRLD